MCVRESESVKESVSEREYVCERGCVECVRKCVHVCESERESVCE